jgi:hypothetical protein
MAHESIEDMNRQLAKAKCSVCGAQAAVIRDESSYDFDGRLIDERSFRCEAHQDNTGPGRLS